MAMESGSRARRSLSVENPTVQRRLVRLRNRHEAPTFNSSRAHGRWGNGDNEGTVSDLDLSLLLVASTSTYYNRPAGLGLFIVGNGLL